MMKRILKRPMFKMGGDVENVGIMDGMRQRYAEAGSVGKQIPGMKEGSTEITMDYRNQPNLTGDDRLRRRIGLISSLIPGPNLNQFLIDFGLNLASGIPRGNILSTAAAAARDPFQRFMAGQQTSDKTKAALALEALSDDDMITIEKKARAMSNNPKSPYYKDFDGALNALSQAELTGADPFRKLENPDVTSYRVATEEYRMGDIAAKQAVPYIKNITKIDNTLKKENIFIDERNPFKFKGRKKYENGAAYIEAGSGRLLRYDKGQNSFTDISDQVNLSELI